MAFSRGPSIVKDGLVLYLDAANQKSYPGSGTTWGDLSGNGNNGTLVNGPTFDSGNVGSIVFDGVDDSVELSTAVSLPGAFTLSCWFIKDTDSERSFLGKSASNEKILFLGNNNIFFRMVNGGASSNFNINYTTTLNGKWNFLTAIRSSLGVVKSSLNGELVVAGSTLTGTFSPSTIVKNNDGQYWDGKLVNNLIYNRELTAQEIQQNYNATKSRFGL